MMKFSVIFLLALTFCSPAMLHADPPEDWYGNCIDTTVVVKNNSYRIRRITRADFDTLHTMYFRKPSAPVRNAAEAQKLLGKEIKIVYFTHIYEDEETNIKDTIYFFTELRKGNEFRFIVSPESEGFASYYPRERIILYEGGHSSDQAVFADTGERAYNPEYSTVSEDKRYRMAGLHSGQDNVEYCIQRYNPDKNRYENLCLLYEITSLLPNEAIGDTFYVYEQFIADNTLYFRTGYFEEGDESNAWWHWYRYISITLPE